VSNTLVSKAKFLTTSRSFRKALMMGIITWDYHFYLFTFNTYITFACVHLDNPSKIIDACYLEFLDTYLIMHLGSSC
jgi:hypothetical protein